MKTLFLSLVLSATALLASPKTARAQTASAADVTAIKAVIERETTSWSNRDAAAWADCWANVPEAGQLVIMQDAAHTVIKSQNTKTDMPQVAKQLLASMGPATGETFARSNYLIRVKGDAAFVQYEQVGTQPDGKKGYTYETRYLEKMADKWKIVHVCAAVYTPAN